MTTEAEQNGRTLYGQARRGWLWGGADQFIQRGLSMVVSLVLARLLEPSAFGLIASIAIFLTVAQQLIDGGIAQRVIQKPEVGDKEYTALFWCNGLVSLLCAGLLIAIAGWVAQQFGYPELRGIMVALALTLVIMNAGRVQLAWLIRSLRFRAVSVITMVSVLAGSVAGIWMALQDYGVWALIGQQMVMATVRALVFWVVVPYRPRGWPELSYMRDLYVYGLPVMLSQVFRAAATQLINVFMVTRISATVLGYYDRGRIIPQNLGYSLANIFNRTNFPVLSRLQHNETDFRDTYLQFIGVTSATYFMLLTGLAVCGRDVVVLLLGEQWLPSVWFLQANCVAFSVYVLFTANAELLRAKGLTRAYFRYNMWGATFQVAGVLAGMPWGARGMVVGDVVGRAMSCIPLAWAVSRNSLVSPGAQCKALIKPLAGAAVVALALWGVQQLSWPLVARFIASGGVGLGIMLLYWKGTQRPWGARSASQRL